MASSKKKRAVDQELNNVNEEGIDNGKADSEMDQDEIESFDQEIEVDFDGRTAEDNDFHGIRKLLEQLFLKAHINLGELTDTIIGQNYIGSVIKQNSDDYDSDSMEDDEGTEDVVFGLVTVVNMTDKCGLNCVKELKTFLLTKCSECSSSQRSKLESILTDESKHVGLLLNERFINIPPQIAVPTLHCLWSELAEANKKKMKYDMSYYVMICKTYFMPSKDKKTQRMFINNEEQLFYEASVLSFDYSVKSERDTALAGDWSNPDEDMEPFRTVLIIPSEKISGIMSHMNQLYSAPIR